MKCTHDDCFTCPYPDCIKDEKEVTEAETRRIETALKMKSGKRYDRDYYESHKEYFKEYSKKYREKHKEEHNKYMREYYALNKEKLKAKQRERDRKRRERLRCENT